MAETTGCYLTLEETGQGTLFLNWSETTVPSALAFFKPTKTVPKFKFKQNGGKTELMRDCGGGVKIKKFYQGITQYVKLASTFNASLYLIPGTWGPNPTSVYLFQKETSAVTKIIADESETNLAGFSAAAAVHTDSAILNVEKIAQSIFMTNGESAGASLAF